MTHYRTHSNVDGHEPAVLHMRSVQCETLLLDNALCCYLPVFVQAEEDFLPLLL